MNNIKDLNIETIRIITVAKVASSTFKHSLHKQYKVSHGHSLMQLKEIIENESNVLIVSGIRNPLARNLSYFFQTYSDSGYNDVKCRANKYQGEKCYIMPSQKMLSISEKQITKLFFKQKWHTTFNDWFDEFFELTYINHTPFNIDLGYQLYCLDATKNIWLLFYTFETLEKNTSWFEAFFNISKLEHTNKAENRIYNETYASIKKSIVFPQKYKQKLLDTRIIKHFYKLKDIKQFYI
ncbi:hypothetical protein OAA09_00995 [bacterium]|nr:hypothetical protein [bacterium]